MGRHGWWMILGCTLPLLLVFFAPALGLGQNWGLFLFIVLMFLCHFAMMGMHGRHGDHGGRPSSSGSTEENGEGFESGGKPHGSH